MTIKDFENKDESIANENVSTTNNIDELNNIEKNEEISNCDETSKIENDKTTQNEMLNQTIEEKEEKKNHFAFLNKFYNYNYPKKNHKKATDALTWNLVGILGTLLVVVIMLLIVGFKPAVVTTPSMKNNINPGDLIFFKDVPAETINVGDVITFYATENDKAKKKVPFTHRVIEIITNDDGTLSFRTQGDNNKTPDNNIIPESRVLGKVQVVIPWIGLIFFFVKNNLLIIIGAAISIIIFSYIVKMYLSGKNDKKDEENKNDSETKDKEEKTKAI